MSSSFVTKTVETRFSRNFISYWLDSWTIARYSILTFSRYRSWFLNLALGPFLMMAPFVFLGDTLVGRGESLSDGYFAESQYVDYIGFLAVPLIALNLSNTVFSWIGGLIRQEQWNGTLERSLLTIQFTSTMYVGRAVAHAIYIVIFTVLTIALLYVWIPPTFAVNWWTVGLAVPLHILCIYGMAFAMSSLLLRVPDAWTVQTVMSRAVLTILSGATFPLIMFPGWLQGIAKTIPFTWLFDIERRGLLANQPPSEMIGPFVYVFLMTGAFWVLGTVFLKRELRLAKQQGSLGGY